MERADSETSAQSLDGTPGKPSKLTEIRQAFGIANSEVLVDDFICALKRSILYQGRLYIFDHHACFESHLFGRQKLLKVSFQELTAVKKRKNYGFPNTLELAHKGKRDTLTSFLKRDDAHKMLIYAWKKSNPDAARLTSRGSQEHAQLSTTDSKKVLGSRHLAKLIGRPISGDHPENADEPGANDNPSVSGTNAQETSGSDRASFTGNSVGEPRPARGQARYHDSGDYSSDDDDMASETTDTPDEVEQWQAVAEPAPPMEPGMKLLVETELDVTVRTFYKEFLSDDSQFFISWHQSRGDTKVQLSEWGKHSSGYVRDLTFITPLKQKIGPSKCLCTQTQRTRLHPQDHLVFNTSQIMDIPYGDYFSVNTHWNIRPAKNGQGCKVSIYMAIPFSKKTMFKSTIESSTNQLMTSAYEDWIATARKWLEDPLPIEPKAPESCFSNVPGQQTDPEAGPTHFSRAQSLAVRMSMDWKGNKEQSLPQPGPSQGSRGGSDKKVSFEHSADQTEADEGVLGMIRVYKIPLIALGALARPACTSIHNESVTILQQHLHAIEAKLEQMSSYIVDLERQIKFSGSISSNE